MENTKRGCFNICSNCMLDINCCSVFDKINSPVLNKEELIKIREFLKNDNFYDVIDENLFKLKVKNNKCIFLNNGKCTIYNYRPIDCKLYPFDIIKKDSKYYLILYSLNCIENKIEYETKSINSLIDSLYPWIDDFTDERNYTKMKTLKYKIIKEIK